jgi:hypothetical protein
MRAAAIDASLEAVNFFLHRRRDEKLDFFSFEVSRPRQLAKRPTLQKQVGIGKERKSSCALQ